MAKVAAQFTCTKSFYIIICVVFSITISQQCWDHNCNGEVGWDALCRASKASLKAISLCAGHALCHHLCMQMQTVCAHALNEHCKHCQKKRKKTKKYNSREPRFVHLCVEEKQLHHKPWCSAGWVEQSQIKVFLGQLNSFFYKTKNQKNLMQLIDEMIARPAISQPNHQMWNSNNRVGLVTHHVTNTEQSWISSCTVCRAITGRGLFARAVWWITASQ